MAQTPIPTDGPPRSWSGRGAASTQQQSGGMDQLAAAITASKQASVEVISIPREALKPVAAHHASSLTSHLQGVLADGTVLLDGDTMLSDPAMMSDEAVG